MSSTTKPSTTQLASFKQRKWFLDLSRKGSSNDKYLTNYDQNLAPIGYTDRALNEIKNTEEDTRLAGQRSWEIALGPIKQAPMNVLISWMAGNSIALFPIMFVGMLLFRPIQSIFTLSKAFEAIEGENSILQKATYLLGNIVNLGIAFYKCNSMGLLPTYASDWLAFANPQDQMENSGGGFILN
jgi:hypothetical protein